MRNANLVRKVDIRATLLTFAIGDRLIIKERDGRYPTIYKIARSVETETGRKYTVTIAGIQQGTSVTRTE